MSSSPNDPARHCAEQPELTILHSNAERRRMLLKGLGKGSAIAAAAVPIKSMAATALTADGKLCTISGVASGVRSVKTGTTTCIGRAVSYWTPATRWPKNGSNQEVVKVGTTEYLRSTATFFSVFGAGSTSTMATLFSTVTDETHWIVALLNSNYYGSAFPYDSTTIVAQYNNTSKRAAAIAFYKNYMETATS